ncbi:MAG: phospholipase [Acidocella sp.]|nr:phospholipase [Acidocella sp.]
MANLSGPSWGPGLGGAPRQLVFLIHGLGADGRDLIDLAPYFAASLPHALFLAPDAPYPCDMAPFGRQWFSLRSRDPALLEAGARQVAPMLESFIETELARWNLTDYALLGFSQGAMMSLFTGLRSTVPPRAILAYSGALLAPQALAAEAVNLPPILIAHGEDDDIVPVSYSHDAENQLRAAGLAVEAVYEPDLRHGLGEAGLAAGAALLASVFQEMA